MRALVVVESWFGNTAQIAEAIAMAFGKRGPTWRSRRLRPHHASRSPISSSSPPPRTNLDSPLPPAAARPSRWRQRRGRRHPRVAGAGDPLRCAAHLRGHRRRSMFSGSAAKAAQKLATVGVARRPWTQLPRRWHQGTTRR